MLEVCEYEFYRNKEDPNLYRYRHYETRTPNIEYVRKFWKPWSKWLTVDQIKHVIKERRKFPELEKGLREMKPGTYRRKQFVEEKNSRDLYMWNKPTDIGKLHGASSQLSRIYAFSESYPPPPVKVDDILQNFVQSSQDGDPLSWYVKLDRIGQDLHLKDEEKKKFEEAKYQGNFLAALREIIGPKLQKFLSQEHNKGQELVRQNLVLSLGNDVYTVKDYQVDIRQGTCTCPHYSNDLEQFKLFCKHLYAAHLFREQNT